MAYLALQQYEQVCQLMPQVIDERPTLMAAQRLLGEAFLRLGNTTEARQHLEIAFEAAPNDAGIAELLKELEGKPRGSTAKPISELEILPKLEDHSSLSPLSFTDDEDDLTATGAEYSPMVLPDRLDDDDLPMKGKDQFLLTPDDSLLDLSSTSSGGGIGPSTAGPGVDEGPQWQTFTEPSSSTADDEDETVVGSVPDRESLGVFDHEGPLTEKSPPPEMGAQDIFSPRLEVVADTAASPPPSGHASISDNDGNHSMRSSQLGDRVHDEPTASIDTNLVDELDDETIASQPPPAPQAPDTLPPSADDGRTDDEGPATRTDDSRASASNRVFEPGSEPPDMSSMMGFDAYDDRTIATVLPEFRKDMDPNAPTSFPQAYSGRAPKGGSDLLPLAIIDDDTSDDSPGSLQADSDNAYRADNDGSVDVIAADDLGGPTEAMEVPEARFGGVGIQRALDEGPTAAMKMPAAAKEYAETTTDGANEAKPATPRDDEAPTAAVQMPHVEEDAQAAMAEGMAVALEAATTAAVEVLQDEEVHREEITDVPIDEAPTAAMELPPVPDEDHEGITDAKTTSSQIVSQVDEAPTAAMTVPPSREEVREADASQQIFSEAVASPPLSQQDPDEFDSALIEGRLSPVRDQPDGKEGDESATPDMGPPDPDATRVLDKASAAIIRAQASAPLAKDRLRVVERSQPLQDFSEDEEGGRDLEGTDSFSPLAEATMVDEGSLHTLREQLLTRGKGKPHQEEEPEQAETSSSSLERRDSLGSFASPAMGKPQASPPPLPPPIPGSGRKRKRTLPLPSAVDPASRSGRHPLDWSSVGAQKDEDDASASGNESTSSPPPLPRQNFSKGAFGSSEGERGAEGFDGGPGRPKLPPLPSFDRFPKRKSEDQESSLDTDSGRKPKRTLPMGMSGRDPNASTKILDALEEKEALLQELSEETATEIPDSARRLLKKIRSKKDKADKDIGGKDPGHSPVPPPLPTDAKKARSSAPASASAPPPPPPPPTPGSGLAAGKKTPRPPAKRTTQAPTAGEVPALKPADLTDDDDITAAAELPKRSGEAVATDELGTARTPEKQEGSALLDQPFDPGDFPSAKPLLPKIETSIPLRTGDLIIDVEKEESPAPSPAPSPPKKLPSFPVDDPLEQPLKPEDFSSHRIPLPESLGAEAFPLDQPLTPSGFDRNRDGAMRQLPPVSVLDQPISPEDFTPGPLVKRKVRDILEDPFWPEDFGEGEGQGLGGRSFRFGRPEAPIAHGQAQQNEPEAAADQDMMDTKAFEVPEASAEPPFPPPPGPVQGRSAPPASFPPPQASPNPAAQQGGLYGDGYGQPAPQPSFQVSVQEPLDGSLQQPVVEQPAVEAPVIQPGPPLRPEPRERPQQAPERQPRQPARRGKKKQGKQPMKAATKRPKRTGLLIAIGAFSLLMFVGIVIGVMALLSAREVERQQLMAQDALSRGNYRNYIEATQIYQELLQNHGGDEELLAEAARIYATTALEFGTDDDERAETLIHEASVAGADEPMLAPARAAVNLYRGDLAEADQVLTAVQSSTGDNAGELIYLRGLWYLRQDSNREALRRFVAAAEASPMSSDVRMLLAQARALFAQGVHQGALQKLDEVEQDAPRNVASRLLRAKINIETGRDPRGGEAVAREVLEQLSSDASPGQIGWAKLLRARSSVLSDKQLEARGLVKSALDSRPIRDAEFSALAARTLLDLSIPATAREEAKRAVELAPHLHRYRLLLAEALVEEGDLTTAETHLRPVSNSPKASLLQGRIRLAREDLDGAAQRFEEATQGEREAPRAKLYLAEIHLKQGRTQQAIDLLERLADGPPALPQARVMLGEAYLTTNQLEKAQVALERASLDLPGDAKVSVALGKLYARQGDQGRAVQAIRDALDIEPTNTDALITLGQLQLKAGNYNEASEAFDQSIKLRPVRSEALIGRARAATALRDFGAADRYLTQAAKQAPPGHVELARGEFELRQYHPVEAIELLEKAAKALPHDPMSHTLLGDAYVLHGEASQIRRARGAYGEALKLLPGLPEALVGQAEAAMLGTNIGRARKAVDVANEAVSKTTVSDSLQARVITLKGRYSFEINGDSTSAREMLTKALELDDNLAEAHLSLAFVHEDQGAGRDACRHFQRYLDLAEKGPRADVSEARRGVRDNCP